MRSFAWALPPAALLCACNSAAPEGHFDPQEAAFIRQEGKTTIEGQAFLRDRQGHMNVRYAAGEVVRLVPATAYAQARFASFYGNRKFVPAVFAPTPAQEADYVAFTRTTKAGPTGRFSFDKVAPGRYFVATQITWTPRGGLLTEGGAIYDEVAVTGKETDPIEVVLSGN